MKTEFEERNSEMTGPSENMDAFIRNVAAHQLNVWRRRRFARHTIVSACVALGICACCLLLPHPKTGTDMNINSYDGVENAISLYESDEMVAFRSDWCDLEQNVQSLDSDFTQVTVIGNLMSPMSYE